jgi:hypothetical protein
MLTAFRIIGIIFWLASIPSCVAGLSTAGSTVSGLLQILIGTLFVLGAEVIEALRKRDLPVLKDRVP